ncbi:ATP-binding protein [Deinococcus peraridilitoris]|uniref:histidine kinase n=1 Tax=Deinococcus peraridilitoris (strain DSM 19664 / LMG 22246 / CIP 109416 / KR-200) TaxID=937777 RepID=L0A1D1_DEIPD|nr:sensor histidine kinase [Deinococcus peraridilitoris]AFZ66825.1 signal transduction histidine kinase regulating citrate/malate metabolism [Deinococcus peraridilitoris DSM 19664]
MFTSASRSPRPTLVPRAPLGIGARLVMLHLLVLCSLTVLLAAIQVTASQREARTDLGERALATSRLVAQLPEVRRGAAAGRQDPSLNAFVNRLRAQVGADFIVVGDRHGIRLAHPQSDRLGRPMEGGDNAAPLAGREIVSVARGSLGTSVRGKTPVRDAKGRVVGVVSTGYLMPRVRSLAWQAMVGLLPWFLLALALGTAGALLAARLLKRAILNLEPEQISVLVQQQRGVLAALREGVLAVGQGGMIVLTNARANALLRLSEGDLPVPTGQVWPELAALTPTPVSPLQNLELRLHGQPVLVNLEPLSGGGYVASIRDRQEVMLLAEELTQVRGFVEVLRAQSHEYLNRLHTISGLLQLGRPEDALRVIRSEIEADSNLRELLRDIQAPRLVALLIGKRERAQELGIDFRVEPGSNLSARWDKVTDALVLTVGNLTENAFEALRGRGGMVVVSIGEDPEGVQVEVLDNGRGVPPELAHRLFGHGVSTKGEGRGYGLTLVHTRVLALGGSIRYLRRGEFTVFQVSLPQTAVAPSGSDEAFGQEHPGA